MIDESVLDRVCPVPDEQEEMDNIKNELAEEGFVINNFNKGGIFYIIIRIFVKIYVELLTFSRGLINSLFVKHADGDWLEIKAADFGKSLKEAVKTKGYITIYRENYVNALQISKGHMFKTLPDANGRELKYYVLETTIIDSGENVGKVLVEAEEPGIDYNVSSGKIVVSMIHLEGVSSVNNEDGWLYEAGEEVESYESLRERTIGAWAELAERTTEDKLRNVVLGVSGVLGVQIDAQHPRGQGTTDIIITSTTGEAPQELLNRAEKATEYLKGNYDDFLFKSSTIVNQDITLILYIAKDADTEGVQSTAENLINGMMQLNRREEMNCLYLDDIRYILKDSIASYKRVEFVTPSADIELDNNSVLMLNTLNVTVTNIGGA